ncbi:SdpI family protein [Enterococcus cecorum]|nr:SdpI family protein [Enterococcus cecorum]
MNNLHFSKYLMWGSFVLFLVSYYFANHQYSNIFGIIYILFTIIQVFMILNNCVKRPLQIILTIISTVFILLCSLNTQIQHDLSLFLICAGILFMGNLSTSLAYNPFIGIRIFSTRNDPKNWHATHQLLALLSSPISCGILLFCTIFNGNIVVPSALIIWVIFPIIYSVWIYPKKLL